jgi:hypothetical protein
MSLVPFVKYRVYTRPEKTGKPGKVIESKIGQKVMKNRENSKKTWKSHGICHPVKN